MAAFLKAFNRAKRAKSGRPQFIMARTVIAKGIPEVEGTQKGHGEGGAKFADSARAGLGLPPDKHFYVSDEVRAYFQGHKRRLARAAKRWEKAFKAWRAADRGRAAAPHRGQRRPIRVHAQLHRRGPRLRPVQPLRPQHPLRHPRARHGGHRQRDRL
jgi:transketolase